MTSTTHSPTPVLKANRGFTLVELMISATLGGFILTAVLTTFLFLGRSGANVQNYSDMEAQARRALEFFAQDTRQASAITWNSTTSITLTVDGVATNYSFASGTFSRQITGGPVQNLVTGVLSFSFKAYSITGTEINLADLAAAGRSTKQLQISLRASRSSRTVATATNTVLSARFILRNKRVTT